MWLKLDDGFATHPKVMNAGPLAIVIQVRAFCYASQNQTDGFIPRSVVPLLLVGFAGLGVDTGHIDTYATIGCQADELDWPNIMLEHGLWEVRDGGYYIHDYLEWNLSKKQWEDFKKQKRDAGRKGGKARVRNTLRSQAPAQASAQASAQAESKHTTSTSIVKISSLNSPKNSDPEFKQKRVRAKRSLRAISDNDTPTEKHIRFAAQLGVDYGPEWGKFKNYCLAHDKRYANFEAAFRNWLANAAEMKPKGAPHALRQM